MNPLPKDALSILGPGSVPRLIGPESDILAEITFINPLVFAAWIQGTRRISVARFDHRSFKRPPLPRFDSERHRKWLIAPTYDEDLDPRVCKPVWLIKGCMRDLVDHFQTHGFGIACDPIRWKETVPIRFGPDNVLKVIDHKDQFLLTLIVRDIPRQCHGGLP